MGKNDLKVVLEVEKESVNHENEIFYRYRIGDFKLWFSQAENGNIYSVGFVEDGDELKDFDLHVYADEYGRGGYYPNVFEIRLRSFAMSTSEARDYMVKAEKACAVLDTVENFFKNSKHFELYCKGHGIEIEKVTRDDLTQVEDELISRQALLSDIKAYLGHDWDAYNEDCKTAWNVIAGYSSCDVDLFSRSELLDVLMDAFGCDLAYFGAPLQFFLDAIMGIPPAKEKPLSDVLMDATSRAGREPVREETKEKGLC